VGRSRSHNEDCFEIDREHGLYVVADGMGGHSHGEVASQLAVETIRDFVRRTADEDATWPFEYDTSLSRPSNVLRTAVELAHDQVLAAIDANGALTGMGTTVVGCLVCRHGVSLAHVGDSRAYRLRGSDFELLTQDHTWVNEQVMAGFLSEDEARDHPLKNVVTRALGGDVRVRVDIQEVELEAGDRLLLCSDGLTTMLTDREIADLVIETRGDGTCDRLVQEANARGGLDNVTVILLDVEAREQGFEETRVDV
jgi:protein phosphatase